MNTTDTINYVDPTTDALMAEFGAMETMRALIREDRDWHDHPLFMLRRSVIESALASAGCPDEYVTSEMVAAVRRGLVHLVKAKFTAAQATA